MNTKNQYVVLSPVSKLAMAVVVALTLSACSSTAKKSGNNEASHQVSNYSNAGNNELSQCNDNAENIASHAESSASTAQYLAAANAMKSCLSNFTESVGSESSEEQQERMKMMAVTTLNFIKAGDIDAANQVVTHFKQRYPSKDLYFADYTSFLDTASALLTANSLSSAQLSTLNISRTLRSEIERKDYWLSH